jgi:peptide chain release factor 2
LSIPQEEIQPTLERLHGRVEDARRYLNFEKQQAEIAELETAAAAPDFWNDAEAARELMKRLNRIKGVVKPWLKVGAEIADALELLEMAEDDETMIAEIGGQVADFERRVDSLETRALMKHELDFNNAYIHIHAGAGGTESCDWASMLLRMFTRWVERWEYDYETIDYQDGEEAGIRGATLLIKGDWAYGQLQSENGVHRLVRISPFDANKRRHTSFCSVSVWPEVSEDIDIEIRDEDLKVDTFRASGAGGQHVNKTESAVRITHLPSKIVVSCQKERSQHQNRAVAMHMLKARLYQQEMERRQAEIDVREGEKKDIAWGSQIRNYVFQPYQMVKDLRTGAETGNIIAVMDGDIDKFIEAYLRWAAGAETKA